MKFFKNPDKVAGILFLVSVLPVLLAWIVLLLVGNTSNLPLMSFALDQISYIFSEGNPTRLWFLWFSALPLICTTLGVGYLFGAANNRKLAMAMLAIGISLAGVSFVLCDWTIAVFVTVPTFWSFRCVLRI
ncbi:MAG: hypothetical protein K2Y28_02065 [Burkholderiaceae bacterium]|nr:hypothetical protein [Burkholderiaceae bacterium]